MYMSKLDSDLDSELSLKSYSDLASKVDLDYDPASEPDPDFDLDPKLDAEN